MPKTLKCLTWPKKKLNTGAIIFREECLQLAIKQQKDGLWEKHRLESRLYIRRLFEDGSTVTQVFRPCSGGP
jgi:hypothetical protein